MTLRDTRKSSWDQRSPPNCTMRVFSLQTPAIHLPIASKHCYTLKPLTDIYKYETLQHSHKLCAIILQKWPQREDKSGSGAPSSLMGTASTCGMTTWTWADCWRGCAAAVRGTAGTPRGPRKKKKQQQQQQRRRRGATSEALSGRTARSPQRPVQSAACRTPAAAGPPRTSAASASRTGSLRECTGHTSWNQKTGKSSAPSSGTTPAPSVKRPGTTPTHAGTARRRSGRGLGGCCRGPSSGNWKTGDAEKTVYNYQNVFMFTQTVVGS